jgi:hypothetical protein
MYDLLMITSRDAMMESFVDCTPAMLQVLQTWTQAMDNHPHSHILVSSGGWNAARQEWVPCLDPAAMFSGSELAARFRDKFIAGMRKLRNEKKLSYPLDSVHGLEQSEAWEKLLEGLTKQEWNVYVTPVAGGPQRVVRYLSRGPITNRRLLSLENGNVTFGYTERETGTQKTRIMKVESFIKLLAIHIPPKGFHRVRLSGVLAPRLRDQLEAAKKAAEAYAREHPLPKEPACPEGSKPTQRKCSKCGSERLTVIWVLYRRELKHDEYWEIRSYGIRPPPLPCEVVDAAKKVAA